MSSLIRSYREDGFVVARAAVPMRIAETVAAEIERAVGEMALEIGVDMDSYLSVACRWDLPNPAVAHALEAVKEQARSFAAQVVGAPFAVEGATLFRQSRHAKFGTHPHQDVSYRWQQGREQYHLTTWIAFDPADATSGALQVLPGSHHEPVCERVDFLDTTGRGHIDRRDWAERASTIEVAPGDIVLFDARLWHGSHVTVRDTVRRALAIRWSIGDVQFTVPPPRIDRSRFGMDTSGELIARALVQCLGSDSQDLSLSDLVERALSHEIHSALPKPHAAADALRRLKILLAAQDRHHAAPQQGMVWEDVRDEVVDPVLSIRAADR